MTRETIRSAALLLSVVALLSACASPMASRATVGHVTVTLGTLKDTRAQCLDPLDPSLLGCIVWRKVFGSETKSVDVFCPADSPYLAQCLAHEVCHALDPTAACGHARATR